MNWQKIFGTSDYNRSAELRQAVALSHFGIGAIFFPAFLMTFGLIGGFLMHFLAYVVKEAFLDLRRIIGKSRTKWGHIDRLILWDSLADLLFWYLGAAFYGFAQAGMHLRAFSVGIGAMLVSFLYFFAGGVKRA